MPRASFVPAADWRDPRHRRGLMGEYAALGFLVSCGWEIEAHRFRMGRHDVDLVARRGEVIAFVEVKTRASLACGTPQEAVGWRKRRTLGRVAAVWRDRYGRPEDVYRFDLVAVMDRGGLGAGSGRQVEHVADAWRLEGW